MCRLKPNGASKLPDLPPLGSKGNASHLRGATLTLSITTHDMSYILFGTPNNMKLIGSTKTADDLTR